MYRFKVGVFFETVYFPELHLHVRNIVFQ